MISHIKLSMNFMFYSESEAAAGTDIIKKGNSEELPIYKRNNNITSFIYQFYLYSAKAASFLTS